jgi:DNA-binding HxlR family transcriptional regulator
VSARKRGAAGLGRTQKLVLRLLASGSKSARHLAYDWPGLTESAAHSAVRRLGDRGLVDVAGWDNRDGRTYCLTERGAAVERSLNADAAPARTASRYCSVPSGSSVSANY